MKKSLLILAAISLYLHWRAAQMATTVSSGPGSPTSPAPFPFTLPTLSWPTRSAGNSTATGAPIVRMGGTLA